MALSVQLVTGPCLSGAQASTVPWVHRHPGNGPLDWSRSFLGSRWNGQAAGAENAENPFLKGDLRLGMTRGPNQLWGVSSVA